MIRGGVPVLVSRAGDETRTRDIQLGKLTLYQLSYTRISEPNIQHHPQLRSTVVCGMRPLRVCFLWHQHQPDYRKDGGFFLPWVRMHAVKDYVDLLEIMAEHQVKHTVNLVPSLLMQIEEYAAGRRDPVQRLCLMAPADLEVGDRRTLFEWVRTLQFDTMVRPLQRLVELWNVADAESLTDQEVLDLQVLLHLAWAGPRSRRDSLVRVLLAKGRNFSVSDRDALLTYLDARMQEVVPSMKALIDRTGSEVSVTPFHHPILPLLCTTDAAREASPEMDLPTPAFASVDDASWHVEQAVRDHARRFGANPTGMWPAEGSVSQPALEILAANGIRWAATDEAVLRHSLGEEWHPTSAYKPYTVHTGNGPVALLFRDHALSDAIGFEYASWEPEAAADNFVARLLERRDRIVEHHGEEALDWMVIPVMLDGENCWEYYPENGEAFLHALLTRMSNAQVFTTVTCTEAVDAAAEHASPLQHLIAGSWINGTFDIWIGSAVKNAAWSLLRDIREHLRRVGEPAHLMEIMYTLEASDWYWWYDDRHQAPHKSDFDSVFRSHLRELYTAVEEDPEYDLARPLTEVTMDMDATRATFPVSYGTNTMHDADALIEKVTVETDGNWQRLTFHFQRDCKDVEEVFATIKDRHGAERRCGVTGEQVLFQSERHDEGFERRGPREISVYLHSTTHWFIALEEQRSGGTSYTADLELVL